MRAGMLGSASSTYLKVLDGVSLKGNLLGYPLNQWKKVFDLSGKYLITALHFSPGHTSDAKVRITIDGSSFEKDFNGSLFVVYPLHSSLSQHENSIFLQELYVDKNIKIEVMQTSRYETNYAKATMKAALVEIGEIE